MALSVDQKRLKATKFPPEFDTKVDIHKVNIDLMKKWIAGKITTILGDEDDVVVETCYNMIEQDQFPKIKEIQIALTGFLNKDTAPFCKELWNLMISAQNSPVGVPKELLEAKKLELQKEQAAKAAAADSRRTNINEEEDMIDSFRRMEQAERRPDRGGERGRGRGRGRGGFRSDRAEGDRAYRRSSPSPRPYEDSRRRRTSPPRRERDVYMPSRGRDRGRGGRDRSRSRERRRSPSRSVTRSRSPPPRRARRSSLSISRSPPRRARRVVHSRGPLFGEVVDATGLGPQAKTSQGSYDPPEKWKLSSPHAGYHAPVLARCLAVAPALVDQVHGLYPRHQDEQGRDDVDVPFHQAKIRMTQGLM
ncbi:PWI domain-containing protein [Byssothecium circinans]|uniref:PWI domain-containing protein n=1 Tax=Byssothecium circinans TaxID=147558 RepID=A0A6A5U5U2_9PLEO|nr:PWI domain-containing protein [Byssothecium circinans]